ncbi:hypothetical protein TNCV_1599881 [Trichonephila clavipes]|nr:hypothetical protein TNCV_1599881 [Trichonephila clavipes]
MINADCTMGVLTFSRWIPLKLSWFHGKRVGGHFHGYPLSFAALLENCCFNCFININIQLFDLNSTHHRLPLFVDNVRIDLTLCYETVLPHTVLSHISL